MRIEACRIVAANTAMRDKSGYAGLSREDAMSRATGAGIQVLGLLVSGISPPLTRE